MDMAEQLTDQQRDAVYDRGGDLLVSAAAGSGKTKVLVDRLLSYILDPVDPAQVMIFSSSPIRRPPQRSFAARSQPS
jgi:superfamily I DNA/RNA helicase